MPKIRSHYISAQHLSKECPAKIRKCALCKGDHYSSSPKCPKNPVNNYKSNSGVKIINNSIPSFSKEDFPLLQKKDVNLTTSFKVLNSDTQESELMLNDKIKNYIDFQVDKQVKLQQNNLLENFFEIIYNKLMSEQEYSSLRYIIDMLSKDKNLSLSHEFLNKHKSNIPPRVRKKKQPSKASNIISL